MYRVLVVDDEKYIRRSIINRIRWEECGTEVAGEAGDGKEACELIALYRPEIVITDIRMPGMDGLELAEWIAREYPSIRMIIISAYNDFEYARKAIRYGVKEYLLKPVVGEELEGTLLRLEMELEQAKARPSFPEISAESAEKTEFSGGEFFVTSFFLPEIKDEFRQEEMAGEIWKRLEEEKKNRALEGEFYFLREGQEEQCSFLWNSPGLTEKEVGEILRGMKRSWPAEEAAWVGVSGQASGKMEEKILLRLQSEALTALKRKIFFGGGVL